MFGWNRQPRIDHLEDAFVRNTALLERVIAIQEQQQHTLDRHEGNFERILARIDQSNEHIDHLYEEIKGLRTESLRIQRHFFGEEVDDGNS